MDIFKAFAPISKVDDEQRMVYGYASTDTKDSQGDVVKLDAIEKALPDYMRFANIREMHTMSAVGVAKSAEVDEKGLYLGAKVVDDAAWLKVKEGVYKGFSIGGKALKKSAGVIEELRLTEISLVDRPANQECVIDMWKAEGGDEAAAAAAPADATTEVAKADEPVVDVLADIRKYAGEEIWDAGKALAALNCVFELLVREIGEKEENADQQAALRTAIAALKAFIVSEIQETNEPQRVQSDMTYAMADGADDDVAKAGATYSKATKVKLAEVHKMMRDCVKAMDDMGYDADDEAKAAAPETVAVEVAELAKAAGIAVNEGTLYADIAKAALADLAKAQARVTELEAQPEPAKAAVTTIDKADDTKDSLASPALPPGNPDDPLTMFKAALARPLVVGAPISQPSSVN